MAFTFYASEKGASKGSFAEKTEANVMKIYLDGLS
jgi:hypothetical protein